MATKAAGPARPRRKTVRETVPDTPDPVDIAMAAAASGKPIPEIARRVLEEHAELVRAQCAELRLRKIGEGVRAALWAMLAIVAFAILALMVAVVARAARSDALIVESFRVPPALAARGFTGEVVATQVLDRLAELQKRTTSIRAASTYANNWQDDLKIDIPNTGTTTDQVWRLLRGWLGKETRISGEVIDTGKGLALTARVGANPGRRFLSESADLDSLISEGAELIYKETQPYRYATSLSGDPNRLAERIAIYRRLTRDPSPVEQKWALNGLATERRNQGDFEGAIAMARRALVIDPNMLPPHQNMATIYQWTGRERESIEMADRFTQLTRRRASKEYDPAIVAGTHCRVQVLRNLPIPDPIAVLAGANCAAIAPDVGTVQQAPFYNASGALFRHEFPVNFSAPPFVNDTPADTQIRNARMRLIIENARGPTNRLLPALQEFNAAVAEKMKPGPGLGFAKAVYPSQSAPYQAHALSLLGRHADAQAVLSRSPRDCYECVRVRGVIAAASGRPQAAQHWYAEAIRQGPEFARAYVDWARLLARHRRWSSAEARFEKAAGLAPNWADPLKYWGDALAAQGRREDALEKYEGALELAPKWVELRAARAALARN